MTSVPGRQLASARVGIETIGQDTGEPTYFIDGEVSLAGVPAGDPDAALHLGFGHREAAACQLKALLSSETSDSWGTQYEFVGYNPDYFPSPSRPWDCVAVFIDNGIFGAPQTVTYDAFVAPLVDTRKSPKLGITKVELLGRKQKVLRLVRGVPTRIGIEIRNKGEVATRALTARGSGRGLRVTRQRSQALGSERDGSTGVTVRLTGRQKRTRLKIVVGDGTYKAVRKIRVVRIKPPRRPLNGTYRSPSGEVRFSVRRSRIIGWHGTVTTRCGGFPDPFTYMTNTYSFPKRRIPRNGIVQSVARGSNYSTSLRVRVAGGKVTRGLFTYVGPARCFASLSFNAKRIGR